MDQKAPGQGMTWLPKGLNKRLTWFLLLWVILEELLIGQFSFPGAIRYLNDLVLVWLLLCCVVRMKDLFRRFRRAGYALTLLALCLYVGYILLSAILNRVDILLTLWGLRNSCRCLAFFVICVHTLEITDLEALLTLLDRLQWVNLLLCLFQFFVLDKSQDYLGGLFGTAVGCNVFLNIYLCFVMGHGILRYLHGRCSIWYLLASLVSAMVLAGMAELKVLYVELLCILIAAAILVPRRKKLPGAALAVVIALAAGLFVLWLLFPVHFAVLLDPEKFREYGVSQEGGYGLSRFHAFEKINELFFKDSLFYNLFGFGLGSCEGSRFSFLTSDFFRLHGHYNYRWFTHQTFFLETGYLGLGLYLAIIGSITLTAWARLLKQPEASFFPCLTVIMCMTAVISMIYDSTLRIEAGYLLYFTIAADAIARKGGNTAHPGDEREKL